VRVYLIVSPWLFSLSNEHEHSEAVCMKCDVLKWDDQVSLFELAIEKYDAVDIVVSRRSCVILCSNNKPLLLQDTLCWY